MIETVIRKIILIFLSILILGCGPNLPNPKRSSSSLQRQGANCNLNSGAVCGQLPRVKSTCPWRRVLPEPVTYPNECSMVSAEASLISVGACP